MNQFRPASMRVALKPRLLLIEDDPGRVALFQQWIEGSEFVLLHVRSGGAAMGVLSRGYEAIAGVMLDHDLSDSPLTETDLSMSTSSVMHLLCRSLPKHVPVLIHSHNASKPPQMQRALETAGLSVTRKRFFLLQQEPKLFQAWLQDARDNWDSEA